MGDILIKNIDKDVFEYLVNRAESHGATVEEEAKEILIQSAGAKNKKRMSKEEFAQWADEFSRRVGPQRTDSTQLIREDRNSR